MVAPFRIRPPGAGVKAVAQGDQDFRYYLDRLLRLIPAEAVSLYLVGSGLIPPDPLPVSGPPSAGRVGTHAIASTIWAVVCLIAVLLVRIRYTADPQQHEGTQWPAVAVSAIAFVIWVYTLGGPFADFGIYVPWLGSLLVLAWTFFVPYFYQGKDAQ
jgi:hypothetical protein